MGSADPALEADQFWRFSCELYADAEIAKTCLALQDEYALNVNLLLLAVWLGRQQIGLSMDDFGRLTAAIAAWQHKHLQPIRELRRQIGTERLRTPADLKHAVEQLYGQLKQVELTAEKIQQQQLITALMERPLPDAASDPTSNLYAYIDSRQLAHAPELMAYLKKLG